MIIDNGGPVELMQFVSERKEGRVTEPERLVDGARAPTKAEVADFIGKQNAARWADLTRFIAASYPGVFDVEWLFGGKKYGWTLRFKKSKSFCSLVPSGVGSRRSWCSGGPSARRWNASCPSWSPTFERTTWGTPRTTTASGCS